MQRSTLRLIILLLATALLGGFFAYDTWRKQGGAEDILTMQGVPVCATSQDFNPDQGSCPTTPRYVTDCEQAKAAITALPEVQLRSQIGPLITAGAAPLPSECELKTVNANDGLYALVVHAYYPISQDTTQPLAISGARGQALNALYSTYSNLYQSYLALDLSTASISSGIAQSALYQAFTPAFLVKGEPGFRMSVTLEDENGMVKPGSGTLIDVSCGTAHDTMVVEPNGNSWFSYEGYEKMNCGNQPLMASVVIERDRNGRWLKNTPSYNHLYEPATPITLAFQNRPQPVQAAFTGKWQGLATKVQIVSHQSDGSSQTLPLANVGVTFLCDQTATPQPTGTDTGFTRLTDSSGRAVAPLADAEESMPGCATGTFTVKLSTYNASTGAPAGDPAYDYYFGTPGPIPAGRINGATFTGGDGIISGLELAVGGSVRIANVGNIPGGIFTNTSRVCLFYSPAAAELAKSCPDGKTPTSMTVQTTPQGRYLFGNDQATRISYGDYRASGSGPIQVRIANHSNELYPADIVQANNQAIDPAVFNGKDITLPADEANLKEYVCMAVIQTWGTEKECDPLINIITRESRWIVSAANPSSGACGLFQSNPCSKYQSTALPGENYQAIGNQIRWGIRYIKSRYGTPSEAWNFWQANKHY